MNVRAYLASGHSVDGYVIPSVGGRVVVGPRLGLPAAR